jgi:hypothetical protein
MNRRRFLQATGVMSAATIAGCAGNNLVQVQYSPTQIPSVPENRPNAVYYPSHVEGMAMLGTNDSGGNTSTASSAGGSDGSMGNMGANGSESGSGMTGMPVAGDYQFGLMYSYPHRFWNVNGTEISKTPLEDSDSLHLMASVWEPQTQTVLPDTGLSVELSQGGTLVTEEVIYPMLSEQMGFHYGSNFELPGDGTYTATLDIGAMSTRRTGAFQGLFEEPRTAEIEFEYSQQAKEEISFRLLDRAGERGAIEPMAMPMVPQAYAPSRNEMPGRVLGEETSGDGVFVPTVLDSPPAGIDGDGQYLAVSARVPYYPLVLPSMALSGTLDRGGTTVFDGELLRTLDPELNYHYGAVVESVESGDELTVRIDAPPQTARHEGYETAFLDMPEMTFTAP